MLALIYASRRLKCYSQDHKIEVLTNYSVKQILLRPEKSRCLTKWAIDLGQHEIDYRSCTSLKVEALIDFLVKITDTLKNVPIVMPIDPSDPEENQEIWELHTDKVASKEGSRSRPHSSL